MAVATLLQDATTGGPNTVDTVSRLFGYDGAHAGTHVAMPFEAMGGAGVASVMNVAVAAVSGSPLPFKVVARDASGAEATVQSGVLAAGMLQDDASALSLNIPTFNVQAGLTYAVRLDFPEAPSSTIPGGYVLVGAPTDGSGFVATVTVALV
jgi:hypothetical protein